MQLLRVKHGGLTEQACQHTHLRFACTCIHPQTHKETCARTRTHMYMHVHIYVHKHTCMHAYMQASYLHPHTTYIDKFIHTLVYNVCVCMCTCIHTHTHACIHA